MSLRIRNRRSGENYIREECIVNFIFIVENKGNGAHTSEYQRYCHAIRRIKAPSIPLVSFFFSYNLRSPRMAFGEKRMARQC